MNLHAGILHSEFNFFRFLKTVWLENACISIMSGMDRFKQIWVKLRNIIVLV